MAFSDLIKVVIDRPEPLPRVDKHAPIVRVVPDNEFMPNALKIIGGTFSAENFSTRWNAPFAELAADANIAGIDEAAASTPEPSTAIAAIDPGSSLFVRAIVVILGFIFVAVGLAMFAPKVITQVPIAGKVAKAVG